MSPGRMFLLDEDAVSEYLQQLSDVTNNEFMYTETAGMKQIINNSSQEIDFDTLALQYFRENYT
jgi:hypothetical protein